MPFMSTKSWNPKELYIGVERKKRKMQTQTPKQKYNCSHFLHKLVSWDKFRQ